ncbi:MAG: hypothetical protein CVV30_10365 [Methanomicrobiales archaeon HGW-Methanomicrobiales-1]|nr:MAG: hypothetical protein CVV30_10365 [Methanomicrobiales archaeon HGW-Methanomicrobiales-1]
MHHHDIFVVQMNPKESGVEKFESPWVIFNARFQKHASGYDTVAFSKFQSGYSGRITNVHQYPGAQNLL